MMKTTKTVDLSKLTGTQQIETLRHLRQAAAAWLVGVNASTLGDQADIDRDSRGRYDAKNLLNWATKRRPTPDLSDEEAERLLVVVESLEGSFDPGLVSVLNFLEHLHDRHGDAGLVMFTRELMRHCEAMANDFPDQYQKPFQEPTPVEMQAEIEQRLETERRIRAQARLEIATTCKTCGRLRQGKKWIQKSPPLGYCVLNDICPNCDKGV